MNLVYNGYTYRKKVQFARSTNWVCSRAPTRDADNKLVMCPGRFITFVDGSFTESRKLHNHLPNYDTMIQEENESTEIHLNF